jgi:opacity protein-like surface antigen
MKKAVTALALAATLSSPAFAAAPGGYIDFDYGPAFYTNANFGGTGNNLTFANPSAIQLGGGYRFNPNMAVEGGLVALGDSVIYGTGYTDTLSSSALYGAVVGLIPLGAPVDLFGKFGLAAVSVQETWSGANYWTSTASQLNIMFGFGAQFNINRSWGIRAQYQNFGSVKMNVSPYSSVGVSTVSIGGVYTF